MSLLFIDEQGVKLGIREHRFIVSNEDETLKEIPFELIDGITICGRVQISTQCIQHCLGKGIDINFFSKGDNYFGRLQSTGHVNTECQRLQCSLYETPFSVSFAKQIISSKIHNQKVILKRYSNSKIISVEDFITQMDYCSKQIGLASTIEVIMGYEGYAAKNYFLGLSKVIDVNFSFNGRNRRPPKDEFNSLISFGYSVLMNILYSGIESKGLNPYFGLMHQDREKHPTLASDLMEEWRAVLVDSTALSLINGHELLKEHFYNDYDTGACLIKKEGMNIFLNKLEKKLQTKNKYLSNVEYDVTFRQAIILQIESLIQAMTERNALLYKPVEIR